MLRTDWEKLSILEDIKNKVYNLCGIIDVESYHINYGFNYRVLIKFFMFDLKPGIPETSLGITGNLYSWINPKVFCKKLDN